jgi:hypothetical protein
MPKMLAKTDTVDFRKLLRDVIRGSLIESDSIPVPMGGPISLDDEHDELCDFPSDEELAAYARLVAEVKAEAVAAGETRAMVLQHLDEVIAACDA